MKLFMAPALRYGKLFLAYVAQYLKIKLAYRLDFWVELGSEALTQTINLVFLLVIFSHVPTINGWNREEILFIYGFFLLPFALFNAFFADLPSVRDRYIVEGELDRLLVRPLNSLFQAVLELMSLESLSGMILGGGLMLYSATALDLAWPWWNWPILGILVLSSTLVYGGVFTFLAATGFWFVGRNGVAPLVYNMASYGRYPATIYRGAVRFILTWVLPFTFVGFYPATYFLHRPEFTGYVLLTPIVGLVFFSLGYRSWLKGLQRYMGTGS